MPIAVAGTRTAHEVLHVALRGERLAEVHRVILPQRVPLELVVREDAAQVRMAVEAHAEEVKDEALPPVRRLVEGADGRTGHVLAADADLQAEPLVRGDGAERIDD